MDDIYKVELVKRVRNEREKKGDEDVMTLLTPRERVRKRSSRHRPHAPSHVLVPSEIGYDEERGRLFYNVRSSYFNYSFSLFYHDVFVMIVK